MAESLGSRLLADVEEVGFDEIFRSLKSPNDLPQKPFGLQPLDRLVQIAVETRKSSHKITSILPVIELTSVAPGGGKTHLLYVLTATAVLPRHLGGKQACTILIDTDGSFSVPRLAQHIRLLASKTLSHDTSAAEQDDILATALSHVHIFRPQSLDSLVATLHSLPDYLFNITRHRSIDRRVAFLALDSASAFYWQARADGEYASYISSIKPKDAQQASTQAPGYARLTSALNATSSNFECPIIFTTWNLSPIHSSTQYNESGVRAVRPTLPAPLAQLPILRLLVQRTKIRKLPVGISADEANRESGNRQNVVNQGKFECVVNEWEIDERTMHEMQQVGAGFGFTIKEEGTEFDNQ